MIVAVLIFVIGALAVHGMNIGLDEPDANEWVTDNSVDFSFTPYAETAIIPWCAIYINDTAGWTSHGNYSNVPNGTAFTRGIAVPDTNDLANIWNVQCYNGSTLVGNDTNITFGVDANVPSILLNSPDDDTYQVSTSENDTITLVYTPTDASNLAACELYNNLSGTWKINVTNTSLVSGETETFANLAQVEGSYIWNVWCNDSAGNAAWAEDTNRTITLDTTAPTAMTWVSPANNTVSDDTTPYVIWTQTADANFDKYVVSVSPYENMSNVFQTQVITSQTGNATTLTTLNNLYAEQVYHIQVRAVDKGGLNGTSTILFYELDTDAPSVSLQSPSDKEYTSDTTPDFNVTVTDTNPDTCTVILGTTDGNDSTLSRNVSAVGIFTSGVSNNITMGTALAEGSYVWNIECNDTEGTVVNGSSSLLNFTVDTTSPTAPNLSNNVGWYQTNNTDLTPTLTWLNITEANFDHYEVKALYANNQSVAYVLNITDFTTEAAMVLTVGNTYNFTVDVYDKAGNTAADPNRSSTTNYFVDDVCGTLYVGWNTCGATWITGRNLSQIGYETNANFVSVWNKSNHVWATCNHGTALTNCDLNVGINQDDTHAVWIYVNESVNWKNRTWTNAQPYANITLLNNTDVNAVGWHLEGNFFKDGRLFGDMGRNFGQQNVTMFSMRYNVNGSSIPYVNSGLFATLQNTTTWDYGRSMWIYFNGSVDTEWDVGGW